MTPDFLRGVYTILLFEGIAYTVAWLIVRYRRVYQRKCTLCHSPNIDETGRSTFPIERLRVCVACGETMLEENAPFGSPEITSVD